MIGNALLARSATKPRGAMSKAEAAAEFLALSYRFVPRVAPLPMFEGRGGSRVATRSKRRAMR
eukprot:6711570-Alexandrium_andersonii.AAC.1